MLVKPFKKLNALRYIAQVKITALKKAPLSSEKVHLYLKQSYETMGYKRLAHGQNEQRWRFRVS